MTTALDYDRLAADYARHRRVHPEVLRELADGLGPGSAVLEVGCGTGNYSAAVHRLVGCPCWGTDPSAEMLARAAAQPAPLHLAPGTAEALGFPDDSFDFLFSVDVIHHVGDRPRFFREAGRVLRPGGRVCTVTDSESVIRHRRPLAVYFPETVTVDLARYPAVPDLVAMMQAAGFIAVGERTVEFAHELGDIGPYRDRAFSCLRLIPDDAFRRGLARLASDLAAGPVPCVSRYTLVWGTRPSPG